MNEFFPPTESELIQIIKALKEMLENDAYRDEWLRMSEELKHREQQLNELIKPK